LPAIALAEGVELVATFDVDRASAADALERWGSGMVCDSVDQLLGLSHLDAVMVVTPPQTHAEIAGAVLAAGKPLICEKPVSLSSREAGVLAAEADRRGLPNAVDHEYRFDTGMVVLRDLVRSGAVGKVRTSSFTSLATFGEDPSRSSIRYWNFHHSAVQGGGMLPQYASHLIDLHGYVFGGIEACGGWLPAVIPFRHTAPEQPGGPAGPLKAVEAEDSGALAGRLPEGGAASLALTYVALAMPQLRWAIHGDKGTLLYEGKDGWFGGSIWHAEGFHGEPRLVDIPLRPTIDFNGWAQDLIGQLLSDFAGVVGGSRTEPRYATLADEARVWSLIERWRAQSAQFSGQAF
jgi:predicted dehydrogenase